MIFVKNQLLEYKLTSKVERILWIDNNYTYCFTIDVYEPKSMPRKEYIARLEDLLREGEVSIKIKDVFKIPPYGFLTEKEKLIVSKRFDLIKSLVEEMPEIFIPKYRGKLVNNKSGKKKYIYAYLRTYWQKGMKLSSLRPDYNNCGGKGKERKAKQLVKTGPKKKYDEFNGLAITDDIKRQFNIAVIRYYKNKKHMTLKETYNLFLRDFYTESISYDENGDKKHTLKQNKPSKRQFYYWYNNAFSQKDRSINKKGQRKYLLEDRPTLSRSDANKLGPGWKYQIDATVADVYIVSKYNRANIIGRPIIYVLIDVFSRMVVGLSVGLEGPSWAGAMNALMNTVSNKVDFCKQYNVDIQEEEWPSCHLPQSILADRAEFLGDNANSLINEFDIRIENTPPYRADWKGIVERYFGIINGKTKPFTPGSIDKDFGIRGEKDYRLDAALTLEEFTKIVIEIVRYQNNHHWLDNYLPDEMMIADEIPLTPINIWNWGIKNRSGHLKFYTEEEVKLALMPKTKGRVTSRGIHFKRGLHYSCEKALQEHWFSDASVKGSWEVNIAYDSRNISVIYILNDDGGYEICNLLEHYEPYKGLSYDELLYTKQNQSLQKSHNEKGQTERSIDLQSKIESVTKIAKDLKAREDVPTSKKERLGNIRENRKQEKNLYRKEEALTLKGSLRVQTDIQDEMVDKDKVSDETFHYEVLRRKQRELKKDG